MIFTRKQYCQLWPIKSIRPRKCWLSSNIF